MPQDQKYPLALQPGTILAGQYVIEKVLGQGGFGITYKAIDHQNNNRVVAIKEYFPDAMVYREATTVVSYPGERTDNFEYGKKSFLAEAETLAKFIGNDNIVRVYSYFEENGTAYFSMEYIEGIPFDAYLRNKGGRISVEEAIKILIPVMDALGAVHSAGIIHRDISPDNIYLSNDGRVMLIDFGAARYSLGDKSKSLDVLLKHGFAPKEQYTRRGKQGPFTDIYALGATFYFALTGKRPPDSIERLEEDDLVPPSVLGVNISAYQEEAILKALNVSPSDRYKSMAEFKAVILNEAKNPMCTNGNVNAFVNPVQQGMAAPQQYAPSAPVQVQPVNLQTVPNMQPVPQSVVSPMQQVTGQNNTQQSFIPQMQAYSTTSNTAYPVNGTGIGAMNNQPPVQQMNQVPSMQGGFLKPQKSGNNKAVIAAVSACAAVAVIVIGVAAVSSNKNKNGDYDIDDPYVNTSSYEDYSVSVVSNPGNGGVSIPSFSTYSEPASSVVSSVVNYSKSDLEIIGNTANNIKNDGIYASDGSTKFWVDEDYHSLMSNLDGKKYIYQNQSGVFKSLSYTNNVLYFIYEGEAYSYNISDTEAKRIVSLTGYSNISNLYVTPAFFFIYQDKKLYRINRNTGAEEQYIEIDYGDDITFYDGWLYYITKDEENRTAIVRVSEADFNNMDNFYLYESDGYFSSPVIANGQLYMLHMASNSTSIIRVGVDFNTDHESIWDISKFVNISSKEILVWDLNVIDSHMFFTLYDSTDEIYTIYHLVETSNTTYDSTKSDVDAYSPVLTIQDNQYKLNYMKIDSDEGMDINTNILYNK